MYSPALILGIMFCFVFGCREYTLKLPLAFTLIHSNTVIRVLLGGGGGGMYPLQVSTFLKCL